MKEKDTMATKKARLIEKIAYRAVAMAAEAEHRVGWLDVVTAITMADIAHPLRLEELECADDFNFSHDVFGILRYIDRKTGEMRDCFVPRFSHQQNIK